MASSMIALVEEATFRSTLAWAGGWISPPKESRSFAQSVGIGLRSGTSKTASVSAARKTLSALRSPKRELLIGSGRVALMKKLIEQQETTWSQYRKFQVDSKIASAH